MLTPVLKSICERVSRVTSARSCSHRVRCCTSGGSTARTLAAAAHALQLGPVSPHSSSVARRPGSRAGIVVLLSPTLGGTEGVELVEDLVGRLHPRAGELAQLVEGQARAVVVEV